MKKIGILTFANTVNYGAALQAYALQRAVEGRGVSCEVLNYSNASLDGRERGTRPSVNPRQLVKYLMRRSFENKRMAAFDRFGRQRLHITERLDRDSLIEESRSLDCVLIGSDQVFNPRVNGFDATFFGKGLIEVTRVASYAASLGDATAQSLVECDPEVRNRLSRFIAVSVRERSSISIIRELGVRAVFSPDPTLLICRNEWDEIADDSFAQGFSNPYVFLYSLNLEEELIKAATKAAVEQGVDLICVHYNTLKVPGGTNLKSIAPESFVALIKYASAVYTDSFHGTCLSIAYNKRFFVKTSGAAVQSNIRLIDLLARYGLSDRLLGVGADVTDSIDYKTANRQLNQDRESALSYLSCCFEQL